MASKIDSPVGDLTDNDQADTLLPLGLFLLNLLDQLDPLHTHRRHWRVISADGRAIVANPQSRKVGR